MPCKKRARHEEYIKYHDFKNEINRYLRFKQAVPQPDMQKLLHKLVMDMSDLTGFLLLKSDNAIEYYGTGFILKIIRQKDRPCPCPLSKEHTGSSTEHAIVTVSTAYHTFNESKSDDEIDDESDDESDYKANGQKVSFDRANEIWGQYSSELKLDYNTDDATRVELFGGTDLPTLYGHRLIETDKDLDYDSDWCAAEFITHDTDTIGRLEGSLYKYQSGLVEAYELSKIHKNDDLVIIVGHPHNWAKRISIGVLVDREWYPKKKVLKEIRGHQTWCRYTYNAVTCNGSSGSPVFKWGQPISGVGYWFGHPHNHCEGFKYFAISTIGVENII